MILPRVGVSTIRESPIAAARTILRNRYPKPKPQDRRCPSGYGTRTMADDREVINTIERELAKK